MERKGFYEVFQPISGNQLTPSQVVRIGGVTFGPGVTFSKGASFGGIDLFNHLGKDLAVEQKDEVLAIRGIYKN